MRSKSKCVPLFVSSSRNFCFIEHSSCITLSNKFMLFSLLQSSCCYCGGGKNILADPPQYEVTCENWPDWKDKYEDDCSYYEEYEPRGCPRWGRLFEFCDSKNNCLGKPVRDEQNSLRLWVVPTRTVLPLAKTYPSLFVVLFRQFYLVTSLIWIMFSASVSTNRFGIEQAISRGCSGSRSRRV